MLNSNPNPSDARGQIEKLVIKISGFLSNISANKDAIDFIKDVDIEIAFETFAEANKVFIEIQTALRKVLGEGNRADLDVIERELKTSITTCLQSAFTNKDEALLSKLQSVYQKLFIEEKTPSGEISLKFNNASFENAKQTEEYPAQDSTAKTLKQDGDMETNPSRKLDPTSELMPKASAGTSTKKGEQVTHLQKSNALGDDRNIVDDGGDRRYWYSIGDGFRLLIAIRQRLNYFRDLEETEQFLIKAVGEEYSTTRENKGRIFIADPYYIGNFADSLSDDIKTITGMHTVDEYGIDQSAKNHLWTTMPEMLVLPLLSGMHWQVIRVEINHEARTASILYSDPYGNGFSDALIATIEASLLPAINALISAHRDAEYVIPEGSISRHIKEIDQQGRGVNGFDCGPITFSNIADYINAGVSNIAFADGTRPHTISTAIAVGHEQAMIDLRARDVERYVAIAGIVLTGSSVERIENIKKLLKESAEAKRVQLQSAVYKDSAYKELATKISSLPDGVCSFIFEIIDSERAQKKLDLKEGYAIEELTKAYNLLEAQFIERSDNSLAFQAYTIDTLSYSKDIVPSMQVLDENNLDDKLSSYEFDARKLEQIKKRILEVGEVTFAYDDRVVEKVLRDSLGRKGLTYKIFIDAEEHFQKQVVEFAREQILKLFAQESEMPDTNRREKSSGLFLYDEKNNQWSSIIISIIHSQIKFIYYSPNGEKLDKAVLEGVQEFCDARSIPVSKISLSKKEQEHIYQSGALVLGRVSEILSVLNRYASFKRSWPGQESEKVGKNVDGVISVVTNEAPKFELYKLDHIEVFYADLVRGLSHKSVLEEKKISDRTEKLVSVFQELGDIYVSKAKVTSNPEFYTDAAKFCQYVLSISKSELKKLSELAKGSKEQKRSFYEIKIEEAYDKLYVIQQALVEVVEGDVDKLMCTSSTGNLDELCIASRELTKRGIGISRSTYFDLVRNSDKLFLFKLREEARFALKEIDKASSTAESVLPKEERKDAQEKGKADGKSVTVKSAIQDEERSKEEAFIKDTRALFEDITKQMKELLSKLTHESEAILGAPPCEYAVIGLGSMALQQITPYSDLEFAILIEDKKDRASNEKNQEYFRKLAHLIHFRVINLGETIIPKSKYGIDLSQYITVGVNFDLGGKTPLGRLDKPYELIQTVEGMFLYLKNEGGKSEHIDKALPWILEATVHVYGRSELIDAYQKQARNFLSDTNENGVPHYETRALKRLKEGSIEYNYLNTASALTSISMLGNLALYVPKLSGGEYEGKLFDVKQEIYRLPDRLLYDLAFYYGINPNSVWDAIDQLKTNDIIGSDRNIHAAHHLLYAASFATSLRLRIYQHYGQQKDDMSVSASDLAIEHTKRVFCLTRNDLQEGGSVFKYYYTVLALHDALNNLVETNLKDLSFYDNSLFVKAKINMRLLSWERAQEYLEQDLRQNGQNLCCGGSMTLEHFVISLQKIDLLTECYLKTRRFGHATKNSLYKLELMKMFSNSVSPIAEAFEAAPYIKGKIEKGINEDKARSQHILGVIALQQSRYTEAKKHFESVIIIGTEIGSKLWHVSWLHGKAYCCYMIAAELFAKARAKIEEKILFNRYDLQEEEERLFSDACIQRKEAKKLVFEAKKLISSMPEKSFGLRITEREINFLLADLYLSEGRKSYAKELFVKCLHELVKHYDDLHPDVLKFKVKFFLSGDNSQEIESGLRSLEKSAKKARNSEVHSCVLVELGRVLINSKKFMDAKIVLLQAYDLYFKNNHEARFSSTDNDLPLQLLIRASTLQGNKEFLSKGVGGAMKHYLSATAYYKLIENTYRYSAQCLPARDEYLKSMNAFPHGISIAVFYISIALAKSENKYEEMVEYCRIAYEICTREDLKERFSSRLQNLMDLLKTKKSTKYARLIREIEEILNKEEDSITLLLSSEGVPDIILETSSNMLVEKVRIGDHKSRAKIEESLSREKKARAEIESIILSSFKKLQLKESTTSVELGVIIENEENFKKYCTTVLNLEGSDITEMGNREFYVSLNRKTIKILQQKQALVYIQDGEVGRGGVFREVSKWHVYYANAINELLQLRLLKSNVIVKDAIKLENGDLSTIPQALGNGKRLDIVFGSDKFIGDISYLSIDRVLIPILYKQGYTIAHWVGVIIERTIAGLLIIYLDSENSPMPDILRYHIVSSVKTGFRSNNNDFSISFHQQLVEQQRYNNCGPELIENFVYYLTGTRATQEGSMYLHSLLLENFLLDPVEYALKIVENHKIITFLSNQVPQIVDRPIADIFLEAFMQQGEAIFEMPLFTAKTDLSRVPQVQYLKLEAFDHVREVTVQKEIGVFNYFVENGAGFSGQVHIQDVAPVALLEAGFSTVSSTTLVVRGDDLPKIQDFAAESHAKGILSFAYAYKVFNEFKDYINSFLTPKETPSWKQKLSPQELSDYYRILHDYAIEDSDNNIIPASDAHHKYKINLKNFIKVHPDKNTGASQEQQSKSTEDYKILNELNKKLKSESIVEGTPIDKMQNIQSIIHKANIGFKVLDTVVDSVRVVCEPTFHNTKKVALDSTYLYSMYYGVNSYSSVIGVVDVLLAYYQEGSTQSLKQAATIISYMALPSMLTYTAIPYLGFAYSVGMTIYTGYSAFTNANSFYLERNDVESTLRSTIAYKDLTKTLSESPLQQMYDFASITKGYEVQINNIHLAMEKAAIKTQLEEKGEFGRKLYEYIYEPSLAEKYSLLNQVLQGVITEEETEALKAKHITITSGEQSYEHCMEIRNIEDNIARDSNNKGGTDDKSDSNTEHYYCYNNKKKILDHIFIGGDTHFEVVEHL